MAHSLPCVYTSLDSLKKKQMSEETTHLEKRSYLSSVAMEEWFQDRTVLLVSACGRVGTCAAVNSHVVRKEAESEGTSHPPSGN